MSNVNPLASLLANLNRAPTASEKTDAAKLADLKILVVPKGKAATFAGLNLPTETPLADLFAGIMADAATLAAIGDGAAIMVRAMDSAYKLADLAVASGNPDASKAAIGAVRDVRRTIGLPA